MSRISSFLRNHGIDLLIVAVAVECALEVAVWNDAATGPDTSMWFAAPAAALMVLPLLARRRWPFGAPVLVWLLDAGFSLAVVLGGAAIVVYNEPDHTAGDYIFTPALFLIAWLAGYALRERAAQVE